jgi:hypothetical protein
MKPSFEVSSSFLLQLMKFASNRIVSEVDMLNVLDNLRKSGSQVLTDSDMKDVEKDFADSAPENLKEFASVVSSLIDD